MFSAFCAQARDVARKAVAEAGPDKNITGTSEHAQAQDSTVVAPVIICTGGFKSAEGINQALSQDGVDLVGLGRAAAVDPELPMRLLQATAGTSNGASANVHDDSPLSKDTARCHPYAVRGGEWLTRLVPSKLVGASIQTLWHQFQMQRIARREKPRLDASFEALLWAEVFRGVKYFVAMGGALCLSMLWMTRASTPSCCAH